MKNNTPTQIRDCPRCGGDGYTTEHEHSCDGSCVNCPVQIRCEYCGGSGEIEYKESSTPTQKEWENIVSLSDRGVFCKNCDANYPTDSFPCECGGELTCGSVESRKYFEKLLEDKEREVAGLKLTDNELRVILVLMDVADDTEKFYKGEKKIYDKIDKYLKEEK